MTLASDQLYLPRISENSIPVYESVGEFASTLRTINRIAVGLPVFAAATAVMPWLSALALGLHYFVYFKVHLISNFRVHMARPPTDLSSRWSCRHRLRNSSTKRSHEQDVSAPPELACSTLRRSIHKLTPSSTRVILCLNGL